MITRRKFMAAALVAPVVPLGSAMAQAVKEKHRPSRPTSCSYKLRRA